MNHKVQTAFKATALAVVLAVVSGCRKLLQLNPALPVLPLLNARLNQHKQLQMLH